MDEFVSALVHDYNDVLSLCFGVLCIVGAWRNWNWLCDPTGKPHAPLFTRPMLRSIFFCLGIILVGCSLYFVLQRF